MKRARMTKIYIFNSHTPVTLLQLSHDLLEFATTLTHRSADTFDSYHCKNSIATNALLWQLFTHIIMTIFCRRSNFWTQRGRFRFWICLLKSFVNIFLQKLLLRSFYKDFYSNLSKSFYRNPFITLLLKSLYENCC